MEKSKKQEDKLEKAPTQKDVQREPEQADKDERPLSTVQNKGLMLMAASESPAPKRARTMANLQQTVGNARVSRMAETAVQTNV